MATLTALLAEDIHVKVIIVSGQGERANALEAVGRGAYDFLVKPVVMDELRVVLKRAFSSANWSGSERPKPRSLPRTMALKE